jgi:uncharacterized protein (UPF0332 family)
MKAGTRHLLEKAERAIQAADVLLAETGAEFAAGRAYYAMFYTAEALLHEQGQEYSKHGALHAAYGKEFAKSGLLDPKFHRWLIDAFDVRLQEDYDAETVVGSEQVEEMLEQARTFLAAAREFLSNEDRLERPSE